MIPGHKILPAFIMIIMYAAVIPCILSKQWGSALYWFSAGLINTAVIFLMEG